MTFYLLRDSPNTTRDVISNLFFQLKKALWIKAVIYLTLENLVQQKKKNKTIIHDININNLIMHICINHAFI